MKVRVNGEDREMDRGATVASLVSELASGASRGIAVAVNDEVVARSEWEGRELQTGDRVEVLHAIGGGA